MKLQISKEIAAAVAELEGKAEDRFQVLKDSEVRERERRWELRNCLNYFVG